MPPKPHFNPNDDESIARYEGWNDCAAGNIRKDPASPAVPPPLPSSNPLFQLLDHVTERHVQNTLKRLMRNWSNELAEDILEAAKRNSRESRLAPQENSQADRQWNDAANKLYPLDPELCRAVRTAAALSLTVSEEQTEDMLYAATEAAAVSHELAELIEVYEAHGTGPSSRKRFQEKANLFHEATDRLAQVMLRPGLPVSELFRTAAADLQEAAAQATQRELPPQNEEGYEPEEIAALLKLDSASLEQAAEAATTEYKSVAPQRTLAVPPRWIVNFPLPQLNRENKFAPPPIVVSAAKLGLDYTATVKQIRNAEKAGKRDAAQLAVPPSPDASRFPAIARRWVYENAGILEQELRNTLCELVNYLENPECLKRINSANRKTAETLLKRIFRHMAAQNYSKAGAEADELKETLYPSRNRNGNGNRQNNEDYLKFYWQAVNLKSQLDWLAPADEREWQPALNIF